MTRMMAAKMTDAIFAANRARGHIELSAKVHGATTRRGRVHEAGSLRVRCPHSTSGDLEAVIVNTAGGVAGGDRFTLDMAVEPSARLTVTTAAAEKVYRTLGPDSTIDVTLKLAAGSALSWLPQETIIFDRARLRRSIQVDVDADARLFMAEAVIFGRSGMGEAVHAGALHDRWRVRRGGRLVYAESVALDGDIAAKLGEVAIAKGGVAIATVVMAPADDTIATAVRALQEQFVGEVGISAWNGIAVARLCAADGATLRRDLTHVITAMRGGALPRLWLN